MVGYISIRGTSWYIYYCDFVSYLLVIGIFLEQKLFCFCKKIVILFFALSVRYQRITYPETFSMFQI